MNIELSHHGIKGQKWGVRNAEWYPIAEYKKHLEKEEKTVFISGSSKTQSEDSPYYRKDLPDYVKKSINDYVKSGSKIVVGDAPGIDRQVQDFLRDVGYEKVTVYGPGKAVRYQADKKWTTKPIDAPEFDEFSSEWLAKKDIAMANDSDEGLAIILDEGAKATRRNIQRMANMGKKMSVYELNKLGADHDRIVEDLKEVLEMKLSYDEVLDMKLTDSGELQHQLISDILDDELYHHGIKGQKWGIRNAEWYPIAAWEAAQKAGGKIRDAAKGAADVIKRKHKQLRQQAILRKARRTKEANRKAEEKRVQDEVEKDRVLSRGTVQELLKYTNNVDNEVLARAIDKRQYLDKKIAEVTPKQLTRTEKLMKSASTMANIAGNISKTASNINDAWNKAKPLLENLGLIEKTNNDNVFSKGNSDAVAKEILERIKSGKIKRDDINSYSKALTSLRLIEKNPSDKTDGKTKSSTDKAMEALKLEKERYAFDKQKKADKQVKREADKAEREKEAAEREERIRQKTKEFDDRMEKSFQNSKGREDRWNGTTRDVFGGYSSKKVQKATEKVQNTPISSISNDDWHEDWYEELWG